MTAFRSPKRPLLLALAAVCLAGAVPTTTWADPPPWAPAHGWRKKHDPYYTGYTGKQWPNDYGIASGACNREAVGAVIGGIAGGAIGSQVGKGEGRTVAIIIGTVVGAVIGAQIGRDMDEADRACFGHALELAGDNRRVAWSNPNTGVAYLVTPLRGFSVNGQACREFTTRTTLKGRSETTRGKACRTGDGTWQPFGG